MLDMEKRRELVPRLSKMGTRIPEEEKLEDKELGVQFTLEQ